MAPREDEGRWRRRPAQPGEDTARVRGVGQTDPGPRRHGMSVVRTALPPEARKALRRAQQPEWTQPMLATLTTRTFSDPDWIFERKLDGERCLAFRRGRTVRLLTRNRKQVNTHYPELVEALAAQEAEDLVIDGEIVAFEGNRTSFARLQRLGGLDREASRRALRAPPVDELAEVQVRERAGVRDRRLHGPQGLTLRVRRAPARLLRGRRARVRGEGGDRVRHRDARDDVGTAAVDRTGHDAVPGRSPSPVERPLGPTRARGPDRFHRVDRGWAAPPPAVPGAPAGQVRPRGGPGTTSVSKTHRSGSVTDPAA